MRGLRYDRILSGTALALVLALGPTAHAQPDTLEANVPMPESVTLPPPTGADISGKDDSAVTNTTTPAAPTEATPVEAPPPDPFASLDPAERPIAEKVRDLLAAKVDKIFGNNRKERASVEAFYQGRTFVPVWLDKGVPNARAKAAIERLAKADADGLDLKDY